MLLPPTEAKPSVRGILVEIDLFAGHRGIDMELCVMLKSDYNNPARTRNRPEELAQR